MLINDPARFDGVAVLGVDEHVWRHTRRGDKYVTVIIDLTPVRDGTGPARLLDMVEGRSKQAFKTWLADRPQAWREAVEVVAMDGFTGFKTAAVEELPEVSTVMDPFHVTRLAGEALDECRRRVQLTIHGHRGMKGDPLYSARRTLCTGADLLTDKQTDRLTALFADDAHVEIEATWGIYQRMIAAYRHQDRRRGRELMVKLIADISAGVPKTLIEITKLGRTLTKRAQDVLAYFDRPGTSNGPTEAINGRLEHVRGSALGFRNLTNYGAYVEFDISDVLGDLADLRYDARWIGLPASAIGAPHPRFRIFILARRAVPNTARVGLRQGRGDAGSGQGTSRHDCTESSSDRPCDQTWASAVAGGDVRADRRVLRRWGRYAAAVARWERILGRTAPAPAVQHGSAGPRPAPEFVEWLMGLEPGWLTAKSLGLTHVQQLAALGNGVAPLQATAALRRLLGVTDVVPS